MYTYIYIHVCVYICTHICKTSPKGPGFLIPNCRPYTQLSLGFDNFLVNMWYKGPRYGWDHKDCPVIYYFLDLENDSIKPATFKGWREETKGHKIWFWVFIRTSDKTLGMRGCWGRLGLCIGCGGHGREGVSSPVPPGLAQWRTLVPWQGHVSGEIPTPEGHEGRVWASTFHGAEAASIVHSSSRIKGNATFFLGASL